MKNSDLYEVRPIKDLKDMLDSSVNREKLFLSLRGRLIMPVKTYKQYKSDVDAWNSTDGFMVEGRKLLLSVKIVMNGQYHIWLL